MPPAAPACQKAKNSTSKASLNEHGKALAKVALTLRKNDTQAYEQLGENGSSWRLVTDMVYGLTQDQAFSRCAATEAGHAQQLRARLAPAAALVNRL